jgi:hemerythrin-like metal-binding protein
MSAADANPASTLFFTGASPFVVANIHFVDAMVRASEHCAIHASEDIYDANGMKLWASGQPIEARLMERLSNRKLRKPIELCVYAPDPIATAGVASAIEERVAASLELRTAFEPHLRSTLSVVRGIVPNPTELMLLSVMRHSGRNMIGHAALVCITALTVAELAKVHEDLLRPLARAALFHDVGELYLDRALFDTPGSRSAAQMSAICAHAEIGAKVVVELARSNSSVGHLIALSHERLDGWGYPRGLTWNDVSLPAQALLFAEAMSPMLESGTNALRTAAVAARLVPGEFAPDMVDWIVRCSQACAIAPVTGLSAPTIDLRLQQLYSLLSRIATLLRSPMPRETGAARQAAGRWLAAVETLMRELRMTGVAEALACGLSAEPQNDCEMVELAVLSRELLYRVRTLCGRVEKTLAASPELATSALVLEVLGALRACEPVPDLARSSSTGKLVLLPWTSLYSVGIGDVDEQHKILVGLLNRASAASRESADKATVSDVLNRLLDYTREHFLFEERMMSHYGYDGAAHHSAAHSKLAARVEQLIDRHIQGDSPALDELVVFLRQWLISHILQTDKAMGVALNAMGVR